MPEPIGIRTEVLDEIVAHSVEDVPNECCGLVGGSNGEMTTLYRARNAEASPLRYSVHPMDQFKIMEQMEEAGEELLAIYHSHTKSPAYPSQTDINLAEGWPDAVYLICSLALPDSPDVKGWMLRGGKAEEVELAVG